MNLDLWVTTDLVELLNVTHGHTQWEVTSTKGRVSETDKKSLPTTLGTPTCTRPQALRSSGLGWAGRGREILGQAITS